MIEKRKNQRFLMETFGSVLIQEKGSFDCYINNISKGGAMIYVKEELPPDTKLTLSFEVGEKNFSIESIVRSSKDFTHNRKYILRIGKSLDVTSFLNIVFQNELKNEEIEFIRMNH